MGRKVARVGGQVGLGLGVLAAVAAGSGGSDGSAGDNASGGTGGDGSGGIGGDGGTGGTSNGPRTCSSFPAGCSCQDGDPAADDPICTTASVATMPGDVGVCCAGTQCQCTPYICRNDATMGFCSCGASFTITGIVQGDVVTTCPLPTGAQKCCFSKDLKSCTCSQLDCTERWRSVPSCSIGDVSICFDGSPSVSACSTISAGTGGNDGGSG